MLCPMPCEAGFRGKEFLAARQEKLCAFKLTKQKSGRSGFLIPVMRDNDTIVIVHRPQSFVEKPMRVFAQSETVCWVVVSAVRKFVDMSRVDDGADTKGDQTITAEGASIVVSRYYAESEPCFSAPLLCIIT